MALPSIHLANVRSLPNKMDELLLLNRTNRDFAHSVALCFTESRLWDSIPDSGLDLLGFQLLHADCVAELSGSLRAAEYASTLTKVGVQMLQNSIDIAT